MLTTLTALTLDATTFYDWLAKASGAVAVWAATRAHRAEVSEPDAETRIQALTLKVRHPWKYQIKRAMRYWTT